VEDLRSLLFLLFILMKEIQFGRKKESGFLKLEKRRKGLKRIIFPRNQTP
jgi:hypothetical protein